MRRNALLVDVASAALAAILVLVLAPGLAIVGMLALLVLVVCAAGAVIARRRARRYMGAQRPRRQAAQTRTRPAGAGVRRPEPPRRRSSQR